MNRDIHLSKTLVLLMLMLCGYCQLSFANKANYVKLDSLYSQLETDLSRLERLTTLHETCEILYAEDWDHYSLKKHAQEGVTLAQKTGNHTEGANFAVWILRANIYLRSYAGNPQYYEYLKNLYDKGVIEKNKYIQPLYSEIYSYLDYGKLKEAEILMKELETLIDTDNPKQHLYYIDLYVTFKKKSKKLKEAAKELEKFIDISMKIDDPRFEVYAFSRNADFYLVDSINYELSKIYAEKALEIIKEHQLVQFEHPLKLQLSQAYYELGEHDNFTNTFEQIEIDSFAENDNIVKKSYFTFKGDIKFKEKEYKEAIKNYKQSIQFLEMSDFTSMEELTKKIEKCYVRLDDYQEAYKYSNRLNVLQDSLYSEENMKAITQFEKRLQDKDVETEKLRLESKIKAQKKSTLFIGFFSSLVFFGLFFYNRILDTKVKLRTAALYHKNKELHTSLEELEQFSYIASHDIKEPMRVVSSITGLIELKMPKEQRSEFKNEFGLVKNSIKQLYTLIEDLSNFLDFKSNTMTHQITNMDVLMNQVSVMLTETIENSNSIVNYNDLPKIYSCPALLTVIFKNLVENGIKYNNSEKPVIDINYKKLDGRHQFSVRDNGMGIDKKYHDYIFQMFKRLQHDNKSGSGLGLGLVKKSIEKLGGEINLNSKPGEGSEFIITLPQSYLVSKEK